MMPVQCRHKPPLKLLALLPCNSWAQVVKAIGLCKRWRGSSSQALWRRLADNEFRRCAILECYDLLCFLLLSLVTEGTDERRMLADMIAQVDAAALLAASSSAKAPPGERRDFCIHFQISSGPGALMTAASALTRFLSGPVSPDAREDRLKVSHWIQPSQRPVLPLGTRGDQARMCV